MDEVSRGLDEMALGSSENNNVLPSQEVRHTGVEACGCAEVELSRNDSVGAITTPLHRCKGRHHLPIIGEEMQGDQLPRRKPDSKPGPEETPRKDPDAHQDSDLPKADSDQNPLAQKSDQTPSEEKADQQADKLESQIIPEKNCLAQESGQSTTEEKPDPTDQKVDQTPEEENSV